jgi:hypothetical protein
MHHDLPIRRYMKSYAPRLVSSMIALSIAESILLGMFRSITCDFVSGGTGIAKETYCCANVAATFDPLNNDLVITTMTTMATILVAPSTRYRAVHVIATVGVVRRHRHHGAASHTENLGHGSAASPNWWGKWSSLWRTWRSAWLNSRDWSIRPIEFNLENKLL